MPSVHACVSIPFNCSMHDVGGKALRPCCYREQQHTGCRGCLWTSLSRRTKLQHLNQSRLQAAQIKRCACRHLAAFWSVQNMDAFVSSSGKASVNRSQLSFELTVDYHFAQAFTSSLKWSASAFNINARLVEISFCDDKHVINDVKILITWSCVCRTDTDG